MERMIFGKNNPTRKAPCFQCPSRTLGCHDVCPDYLEYRKQSLENYENRHKEIPTNCYMVDQKLKNIKRSRRNKK